LFCGDAEAPQVDSYIGKGRIGDIDLYKVGHHGSAAAVDETMLDALKPEVSLVSVGEGNRYGHPVPATVDALEDAGSTVFRTDEQGMITCFLRPEGMRMRTER
jgi:competence protein ComEC